MKDGFEWKRGRNIFYWVAGGFLRNREWEWVRDSGKLRVGVVVECMKRRKDEMMEFGLRKDEYGVIK